MKTENNTNTENNTSQEHPVDAKMESEIDEAVRVKTERVKMQDEEKVVPTAETEEIQETPDLEIEAVEPEKKAVEDKKPVDDISLERAIKSGMTLSTAKSFADNEALLQVIEILEGKQSPKTEESKSPIADDGHEEDELQIPDLEDEDEYDPGFVSMFKAMKATLLSQNEAIKQLKAGGMAPGGKSWFDSKVGSLGEVYKDSLGVGVQSPKPEQVETKNKVKTKFDVLSAGYKHAKVEMSPEDVLTEALNIVVGDVAGAASDAAKAAALKARNKLQLQRSSPTDGRTGRKSIDDIKRGIADEINQKFNTK